MKYLQAKKTALILLAGGLLLKHLTDGILHCMTEMAELHAAVADGQIRAADDGKGQERIHPREIVQRAGHERQNAV